MKFYSAAVWPPRGRRFLRYVVAEVRAEDIEAAIAKLVRHPKVVDALIEEDPRLAGVEYCLADDYDWMDGWPHEAAIEVLTDEEVIISHPSIHILEEEDDDYKPPRYLYR